MYLNVYIKDYDPYPYTGHKKRDDILDLWRHMEENPTHSFLLTNVTNVQKFYIPFVVRIPFSIREDYIGKGLGNRH